ncbi:hypothetical protein RESH_00776 [Rhodopirellula europaea SH398]|uniref:Uncharacterized protein n=1 Tax=Rhodopirellula europaea SH398 TaxID=1263868 RepID=M5SQS3_9BACT|nr:hypothetical protein RESH_00776 [Rhodopirellula europaea SH398]
MKSLANQLVVAKLLTVAVDRLANQLAVAKSLPANLPAATADVTAVAAASAKAAC